MSTTANEGSQYGGRDGGGAGGKFQKRIFRQKQQRKTPYDRPPSFAAAANNGGVSNGWLSKIVEPASKLITASAHRLFGTVFRKRIGPAPSPAAAPPHPQPRVTVSEAKQGSVETLNHASSNENITLQKRPDLQPQNITEGVTPCNNFENSGFLELEQMLKEKTLSRSEIDHLTSLLHSRTLSMTSNLGESSRSEEKFALDALHKIEQPVKIPLRENGAQYLKSYGIASTPINSAKERTHFVEEDVASPTELAKAYMGNRSPSILGFRSEAFREETPFPNSVQFTPKPIGTSTIAKIRVHENGYMTPRSRGRSAIYSMARTPYSRIPQASSQQGSVSKFNTFGGPSSSLIQGRMEGSRASSSRQVALKRGSYVLDNDTGSIGPIRRIRQKSNLLPASNLSLTVSESPLSGTGTVSKLNKQVNDIHSSTSFGSIPSKSSKMAQKILQELDKLVPSKEKKTELKLTNARNESPASLTHDLLNAQARRSLEDVSFSKFLQNDRDMRVDGSPKTFSSQNFGSSQKQDKIEENNSDKHIEQSKRSTLLENGVEAFVLKKDSTPISKSDDSIVADSSRHTLPQKKWAFQMSAHEEFMDHDTDCFSNGTTPTSLAVKGESSNTGLVGSKPVSVKPVKEEMPPVTSQGQPFTNSISNEKANFETLDGTDLAKINTGFSFTTAPPATNMTIPPAIISPGTDDVNNIQPKEANSVLPVYKFSSNDVSKVLPVEFPSTTVFDTEKGITPDASSHPKLETPSSFGFVAGDTAKVTDKVDMLKKPETMLPSAVSTTSTTTAEVRDIFKKTETTPASISSTSFSFGSPANNVPASNGAFFSNSATVSTPSPLLTFQSASTQILPKSSTVVLESPAFTVGSASGNAASETTTALSTAQTTTVPSFTSTFSSTVSKSPSGIESTDVSAETKQKSLFGNVSNSPFSTTISSNTSTGSSIFGFSASAAATTPVTNPFMGSNPAGASSVSLGNSQPSIGTGATNITNSVPVQLGSSPSFPTFAFGGTTTVASTSSLFSSSASPSTAKPFSFSAGFGLSSSTSSSSTANAITAPTSSIFSSAPNTTAPTTTPVFSFGGAQASSATPNNTSTNSVFPFTPSAANTSSSISLAPSQSLFVNPNPASTFGNATVSNDQMSMEDTMAEDTAQASAVPSPVTTFGQSPISSSPAPGFVFGSTPNPFPFGNQQTAPTMQNPFQFGSQQISTPPVNQSPFQPSGSLDFNAGGGSFSLGTGGGDKSNRRMVKVKRSARK